MIKAARSIFRSLKIQNSSNSATRPVSKDTKMGYLITTVFLVISCLLVATNANVVQKKSGEKAVIQIVVDNLRSTNTTVQCCSGDNDLCQKNLPPQRYYNFAFTPNIWGTTHFNCRATYAVVEDPVAPVIRTFHQSWIAYSERNGGANRDSAVFDLKEDGVYWDNYHYLDWESTNSFPPALPPLCSQHPVPCQAD